MYRSSQYTRSGRAAAPVTNRRFKRLTVPPRSLRKSAVNEDLIAAPSHDSGIALDDFDRGLLAQSTEYQHSSDTQQLLYPILGHGTTIDRRRHKPKDSDLQYNSLIPAHEFSPQYDQDLDVDVDNSFQTDQLAWRNSIDQTQTTHIALPTDLSQRNPARPPIVRGIQLVEVSDLPDQQRQVFKFTLFNAVQSKCFHTAYGTDDNFVVSAPTGSGKTVIMELSILRLIAELKDGRAKVVYQAPTKSLCDERHRDWQRKFSGFGIHCAELTGDTENSSLQNVRSAAIIVTTPEKWDSITRKWKDHGKLIAMVRLFLVDEVHFLKDARGATLEAIVSRMQSASESIRFIALSATIPNSEDIAQWLTKNASDKHLPALREVFDDSFRPVPLTKHVLGESGIYNPWALDNTMTPRMPGIIARYNKHKSSVEGQKSWDPPSQIVVTKNDQLARLLQVGVAFHHAGLEPCDRRAVEQGFIDGNVSIICSTSTLAVGVNLPCYLVVLKGIHSYTDSGIREYSTLEVMQMLGRAGRPQFEDEACALILCGQERADKYRKMAAGEEILESSLHHNLIEHLNAEIAIGSITSLETAKKWLTSTFLSVRLRRNPDFYQAADEDVRETSDATLLKWCQKDVDLLLAADLVQGPTDLSCTEYGRIMARYCVKFGTMKIFMQAPAAAKLSEVLATLVQAEEFREYRLKQGEKSFFKELNSSNDIRFPIKVDIAMASHKASLLIQAKCGSASITKNAKGDAVKGKGKQQMEMESRAALRIGTRLIRCLVDIYINRCDSVGVKSALELARCLAAGVWDDTATQLKQLPGIGDVFARKLAAAGIKSVSDLAGTRPHRLEMILSKNPPFGNELARKAASFPALRISVAVVDVKHRAGFGAITKLRAELGFLNRDVPEKFNKSLYQVLFFSETSYGEVVDFRRFQPSRLRIGEEICLTTNITKPNAKVRCHIMCDDIAGTHRYAEVDIVAPIAWFPPPSTISEAPEVSFARPTTSHQRNKSSGAESFQSASVEDSELLAAERSLNAKESKVLESIAEVEDIDEIMADVSPKSEVSLPKKRGKPLVDPVWREPRRLSNGRWTCQHSCGDDKKECKHKCCLEGVAKKPMKPKQPALKRQKTDGRSTIKSSTPSEASKADTQNFGKGPLDKMFERNQRMDDVQYSTQCHRTSTKKDQSWSRVAETKPIENTWPKYDEHDQSRKILEVFETEDFDWSVVDEVARKFDGEHACDSGTMHASQMPCMDASATCFKNPPPGTEYARDERKNEQRLFFSSDSSPMESNAMSLPPSTNFTTSMPTDGIFEIDMDDVGNIPRDLCTETVIPPFTEQHEVYNDDQFPLQIAGQDNVEQASACVSMQADHEAAKQKKIWDDLHCDVLTYESWGKYFRIIDA